MSTLDIQRRLLEEIEKNPDTTQATMAGQLGVAVGSVNWYLKRLVRKGYVKVTRLQRRKLKYFITPQGLALKAHLTSQYLEASLRVYRELRQSARDTLTEVQEAGFRAVYIEGNSEAIEIFRLTCLEQNVSVASNRSDNVPTVTVQGADFSILWPDSAEKYLNQVTA